MYKDISENLIAAVDLDLLSELDIIWLTVYYLCTRHPIIARFCIPYALSPSVLGLYAEREQRYLAYSARLALQPIGQARVSLILGL